jgi:hypothetical protein
MPSRSNNTEPVVELVEPTIQQPSYFLRQRGAIPNDPGEAFIYLLPRFVIMLFDGMRIHKSDLFL